MAVQRRPLGPAMMGNGATPMGGRPPGETPGTGPQIDTAPPRYALGPSGGMGMMGGMMGEEQPPMMGDASMTQLLQLLTRGRR